MDYNIIHIEDTAWNKILGYARKTYDLLSTEIGGMAVVLKDDENRWVIKDPAIMKQEVTSTVCHLDKQALANWYGEVTEKYKTEALENKLMYCWWHSHHNMGASMSSTDWDTIGDTNSGLALVVNNKGEYELILSSKDPMPIQVKCELENISQSEEFVDMEKEIKECVVKETAAYQRNGWNKRSFKSLRDEISVSNNQLALYDEALDEKGWNKSFGITKDDISYDQVDLEIMDANIDAALIEIDYKIEGLKTEMFTPQEIIDDVENLNKAYGSELLNVPTPKKVLKLRSATDLLI
jgi:hypothetical protein